MPEANDNRPAPPPDQRPFCQWHLFLLPNNSDTLSNILRLLAPLPTHER